jgi:hypothetical protein
VPFERCSVEKQNRKNIVDGRVVSSDVVRMPKHVGATIHN